MSRNPITGPADDAAYTPAHPEVTQEALDAVDVVMDNHDAIFQKAVADTDVRSKLINLAKLVIDRFL